MTENSKKKRGESGKANAKANPFRYNGGTVNPPSMRIVYAMAGLRKIQLPTKVKRS